MRVAIILPRTTTKPRAVARLGPFDQMVQTRPKIAGRAVALAPPCRLVITAPANTSVWVGRKHLLGVLARLNAPIIPRA